MEGSTTAALPSEARTNTTDPAENLLEGNNSNMQMKNEEAFLNNTTEMEKALQEAVNQSESMKNPLDTAFLGKDLSGNLYSDLEGQTCATTGSSIASPLCFSVEQASQDLQAQEDELRELGIDVVDQVSLERRVEAAVSRKPLL